MNVERNKRDRKELQIIGAILIYMFAAVSTSYAAEPLIRGYKAGTVYKITDDSLGIRRIRAIKITSQSKDSIHFVECNGSTNYDTSRIRQESSTALQPRITIDALKQYTLAECRTFLRRESKTRIAQLESVNSFNQIEDSRFLWWEALADPELSGKIPKIAPGMIINIGYDSSRTVLGKIIAIDGFGVHLIVIDTANAANIVPQRMDDTLIRKAISNFLNPHMLIDYGDFAQIIDYGSFSLVAQSNIEPWERMMYYVWYSVKSEKLKRKYTSGIWILESGQSDPW